MTKASIPFVTLRYKKCNSVVLLVVITSSLGLHTLDDVADHKIG